MTIQYGYKDTNYMGIYLIYQVIYCRRTQKMIKSSICSAKFVSLQKLFGFMATGNLIKKKEEFELWLKSQIAKGCDLLKREVSEDDTTIVRYRTIVKIKEYDEDEKNSFLADYKKWDSYNSELISRSFDDNDSPQSYYRVYGRTGDPTRLFGEDIIKEAKQQINEKVVCLESIMGQLPLIPQTAPNDNNDRSVKVNMGNKDVFIVHGHDSGLKNEVARFITDMGYNPIILHEQPNTGKTIIEKIEAFTNVCYAIVLYTPCDKGASKDCPNVQPRARQNVVFEHGYLIGKLGRERVCALIKEEVEKPGDVDGVVYVSYDGRGAWKKILLKSSIH